MTKKTGLRQRLTRVVTRGQAVLIGLFVTVMLTVAAGSALAVPGFGECKDPPLPESSGEGLIGQIDPASMGTGQPGSAYDQFGYAGMIWHNYDVCFGEAPWASFDTWLGNQLFNMAKGIVAVVNMLHYQMVSGVGFLSSLDGLVNEAVTVIYNGAYVPYLAFVLVLVAVAILWFALRGNLPAIGTKAAYVLVALFVASTAYLTPLTYVGITDQLLVDGASELESNMISEIGGNQRHGLPTMLHEEVVYKTWLDGEFGSADSPQANEHRQALLQAQACEKVETLRGNCDIEGKQEQFKRVASNLEGTPAYPHLTGEKHDRAGQGLFAFIKAVCFGLFQLLAKFGVLLAQISLRAFIAGAPIFALVGMLSNKVIPNLGKRIGVTVGMGLLLVFSASAHAIAMNWILAPERQEFTGFVQVLLMAVITAVMFYLIRPGDRIRQMVMATSGRDIPFGQELHQRRMMRRMSRSMKRRDNSVGKWIGNRVDGMQGPDTQWWSERGEPDPSTQTPTSTPDETAGGGLAVSQPRRWWGGRRPEAETITVPSTRAQPRPHGAGDPQEVSAGQGSIPASHSGPWSPSGRPRGNRGEPDGGAPFVATPRGAVARSETQTALPSGRSNEQVRDRSHSDGARRSEANNPAAKPGNAAVRADRAAPSRPGTVHGRDARLHQVYRPNTNSAEQDDTNRRRPRPEAREE